MVAGRPGKTLTAFCAVRSHPPKSNVPVVRCASTPPVAAVPSAATCDPGELLPAGRTKIRPVGRNTGGGVLPGARTFKNTVISRGELSAPGAVTETWQVYCPALAVLVLTFTS